MNKRIVNTMQSDSESVIKRLEEEFPGYDSSSYRDNFMRAMEAEINSGKTEAERDKIRKDFMEYDLLEIQNSGSDVRSIKNIVRENYTHNSLLTEIKTKASQSSLNNTQQILEDELRNDFTPLENLFRENKNIRSLNELSENDKMNLFRETDNLRIDTLVDIINNQSELNEDFKKSLLYNNIDSKLLELLNENKGISKQDVVELLIKQNPKHKNEILDIVNTTVTSQLENIQSRLSEKEIIKFNKEMMKEDFKDIQSLGENRSIDQIKTLRAVNRSHSNLLDEIKKASQSSINKTKAIENTDNNNTQHLEDTMNLFD
jgi:hypothetical protein